MGTWGEINRKNIVYILQNGIDYLRDKLKEMKSKNEKPSLAIWDEYDNLRKLLYEEGEELLSMTNKLKFERNLKVIKNGFEKLDKT